MTSKGRDAELRLVKRFHAVPSAPLDVGCMYGVVAGMRLLLAIPLSLCHRQSRVKRGGWQPASNRQKPQLCIARLHESLYWCGQPCWIDKCLCQECLSKVVVRWQVGPDKCVPNRG